MPNKKPTTCGVDVQTWGTTYNGGDGFWFYLKNALYGGDAGHAAITVTIPANAEGDALIKRYCAEIPYKKKTVQMPNGDTEIVYEIRFSWWPTREDEWFLEADAYEDALDVLGAKNFAWAPEIAKQFKPEGRIYKGLLGSTKKTLAPVSYAHIREDLNLDGMIIIVGQADKFQVERQLESLALLEEKMQQKMHAKATKVSASEKLLVWNMLHTQIGDDLEPIELKEYMATIAEEREDLQDKLKAILERVEEAEKNLRALNIKSPDLGTYLSLGAAPDASVSLPIKSFPNANIGTSSGLDAAAMLREMHAIVSENKAFELYGHNCSSTVGRILTAGVQQPHIKEYAKNHTMGAIGNPQLVYNAALRIQEGIIANEKSSAWRRMANFQPIRRVMGNLLKIWLTTRSIRARRLAGFALLFVLPLAALGGAVRWVLRTIVKVGVAIKNSLTPKKRAISIINFPQTIEEAKAAELANYLQSKTIEISMRDPIAAIKLYIMDLRYEKACIPVFSEKTKAAILARIKKDNSIPADLSEFMSMILPPAIHEQLEFTSLQVLMESMQLAALEKLKHIGSPATIAAMEQRNRSMSFASTSTSGSESISSPSPRPGADKKRY